MLQVTFMENSMNRCSWVNHKNLLYVKYHDEEWAVPVYDDNKLFEMLLLESFQAGLSWECVLNKREAFRVSFDNFNYDKISKYDDKKIEELLQNTGIIRNRRKITAVIRNARVFMDIQKEYQSFSNYLWNFTNHQIIYEYDKTTSELSDRISKDLKRRGMRFVGSTVIYSYLQAVGVINSHERDCFLYQKH